MCPNTSFKMKVHVIYQSPYSSRFGEFYDKNRIFYLLSYSETKCLYSSQKNSVGPYQNRITVAEQWLVVTKFIK